MITQKLNEVYEKINPNDFARDLNIGIESLRELTKNVMGSQYKSFQISPTTFQPTYKVNRRFVHLHSFTSQLFSLLFECLQEKNHSHPPQHLLPFSPVN